MLKIEYVDDLNQLLEISWVIESDVINQVKKWIAYSRRFSLQNIDWHYHVKVAQSIVIDAIRYLIVQNQTLLEEVQVIYKEQLLPINEYGAMHDRPKGFCDTQLDIVTEILRAASDKRKREKEKL
jgi:hypothetical protein